MNDLFDKLLEKPEWYRRNVAIGITAILSVFIFSAWVILTRSNMQEAMRSTKPSSPTDEFKKTLPSLQDERYQTQLMRGQQTQQTIPTDQSGPQSFEDLLENQTHVSGTMQPVGNNDTAAQPDQLSQPTNGE